MPDQNIVANTEHFITRWKTAGAAEWANYQLFFTELCELPGVEKPRPASDKVHEAAYTFERPVEFDKPKPATSAYEQQIGHFLETISTLGL